MKKLYISLFILLIGFGLKAQAQFSGASGRASAVWNTHQIRHDREYPGLETTIANIVKPVGTKIKAGKSQNADFQKLDSIYSYSYDTTLNVVIGALRKYKYDPNGKIVTVDQVPGGLTEYKYDASGNKIRSVYYTDTTAYYYNSYSYTSSGKLLSEYAYYRTSSAQDWINEYKIEYDYDLSENLLSKHTYRWDEFTLSWTGEYFDEYSFDSLGRQNLIIEGDWYDTYWREMWKTEYAYTDSGTIGTKTVFHRDESFTSWVGNQKFENSYDSNNLLILFIYSYWDASSNSWRASQRSEFLYDVSLNLINETNLSLDSSGNIAGGLSKYDYTYDDAGNVVSILRSFWNGSSGQWYSYSKWENTYSNDYNFEELFLPGQEDILYYWLTTPPTNEMSSLFNHKLTGFNYYMFDSNDSIHKVYWVNYYYSDPSIVGMPEKFEAKSIVFPNPTSGLATFSWNTGIPEMNLEILSTSGKIILKESILNNKRIPVSNLPAGIYLYKLSSKNGEVLCGKLSIL